MQTPCHINASLIFITVAATVTCLLTIAACKKFRKHEVVNEQEHETEVNVYRNVSDADNSSRNEGMLTFTELEEAEYGNLDCTYDHLHSKVDDAPPSILKTYQPITPNTLNPPSLYMVPGEKWPEVLPDSNLYQEIDIPVPTLENAIPHYLEPYDGRDQTHFDMDEDTYTEMSQRNTLRMI